MVAVDPLALLFSSSIPVVFGYVMDSSLPNRCFLCVVVVLLVATPIEAMNHVAYRINHGFPTLSLSRQLRPHRVRCYSSWDDFMGSVEDLLSTKSKEMNPTLFHPDSPLEGNWCTIDPNNHLDCMAASSIQPSPVEEKIIDGRRVFIKRDDLLRLPGSLISGNKARKMFFLNQLPIPQFPRCIVSYGGPQSNAMLALAAIVNYKNREETTHPNPHPGTPTTTRFVYYTKKLPRFLRKQASGNLFRALTLGMELVEVSPKDYHDLFGSDWGGSALPPPNLAPPTIDSLWIPQGGANELAMEGAKRLALELHSWWKQQQQQTKEQDGLPVSVVFPGGTCTTAVLVHHALQKLERIDMEVVVIPCVGDATYAQRQMMALSAHIGAAPTNIPHILPAWPDSETTTTTNHTATYSSPSNNQNGGYFPFGEPDAAILSVFNHLQEDHELVLDLVYGAPAWTILLRHWHQPLSPDLSFDPRNPIAGRDILYVHSGGLEGINSQLLRYNYKGLVDLKDIQLP